ncbi:YbaY family lipoprotein [Pseudomonas rubra]|uniref:YbaY family lipoprotein n=1 Tax=Pseudomonas rubra TaxID=2942627 RepID=A0ABT5P884_9PSED|nr:YbaY family lipoprotein [Pseudomonas rubra]MDD1014520.1 YbaY family lipoprotein [Pseudomonas rubra]MDD1038748.1 YbaY family lipoprotein [Pseudomonas rubra]MDD1156447.1 YbaY family lipoprotein [Pseudomonas rubra]
MSNTDFNTLNVTLLFAATRLGLPEGVKVSLNLADVSQVDAPAIMLAEQTLIAARRATSFNMQLHYDSHLVDERNTYALQARIEHQGKLLLTNTDAQTVVLDGSEGDVTMLLKQVR